MIFKQIMRYNAAKSEVAATKPREAVFNIDHWLIFKHGMSYNTVKSEVAAAKPRFKIDYWQIFKQGMRYNATKSEVAAAKPREAVFKIYNLSIDEIGNEINCRLIGGCSCKASRSRLQN